MACDRQTSSLRCCASADIGLPNGCDAKNEEAILGGCREGLRCDDGAKLEIHVQYYRMQ